MKPELQICLFYSYGPHFLRTVRNLRQTYETAVITTFIPKDFPQELFAGLTITCRPILPNPGEVRPLRLIATIVQAIRRTRPDVFIVLFNSPKLRILAAFSGAKTRLCYHPDGRVTPVRWTFTGALSRSLVKGLYGRLHYAYIWCHVHFIRVKREAISADNPSDVNPSNTAMDTHK